jgi:ubiquinone/menaquinone biosynthesis C-methylase UbiE
LDLGCGAGTPLVRLGVSAADEVVGVDINESALATARERFPSRRFQLASAESLPFRDASFDRVVSSVALPYMNIPKALAEARRVLVPGGTVFFSLHPFRFTLSELGKAWPRLVPTTFRLFVIVNGLLLHLTGRTLRINGRSESFQTRRAMRRLLEHAGFRQIEFSRPPGQLLVQATAAQSELWAKCAEVREDPEGFGAEKRSAAVL